MVMLGQPFPQGHDAVTVSAAAAHFPLPAVAALQIPAATADVAVEDGRGAERPRLPQGGVRMETMKAGTASTGGRSAAALLALAAIVVVALLLPACATDPGSRAATAAPPQPTRPVRVEGGRISGLDDGVVRVYRGIPYAAPPIGELRWRPPRPVRAWIGVRQCGSFGPSCPQGGAPDRQGPLSGSQSEDCLYLNVWTPARSAAERVPVMVWIHGGGFISGSGSLPAGYGERLSGGERVVVVSFNYRLGAFGFLAHPALSVESNHGVSGNYGLLDQNAALRWVRRNIAAFGGDPRRVTIFGQSAGGQSVISHLVSPLSRGLFARAIAESPRYQDRGVGLWSTLTLTEQEQEGEEICDGLGIPDGPGALAALRAVPAARLLQTTAPAKQALPLLFVQPPQPSFQPVVDGYVLPDEPWRLLRSGKWARVPLLIGSNQDECNMWLMGVKPRAADTVARAARRRVSWYTGADWAGLAAQFPAADYGGLLPATSRMMTVLEFNAPARYAAVCVARQRLPAYLYYFSRTAPGDAWGAHHSAEVPYVFGVVNAAGKGGSPADQELSRQMARYWATFAATGDPNVAGQPRWPRFDPAADVLLRLDVPAGMGVAPYSAACAVAEAPNREH
jgi:para-nitrobenzyl esterase